MAFKCRFYALMDFIAQRAAVDTFFHGGVSFSHGIYFRLGGCEVKRGAT